MSWEELVGSYLYQVHLHHRLESYGSTVALSHRRQYIEDRQSEPIELLSVLSGDFQASTKFLRRTAEGKADKITPAKTPVPSNQTQRYGSMERLNRLLLDERWECFTRTWVTELLLTSSLLHRRTWITSITTCFCARRCNSKRREEVTAYSLI